MTKDELKRNNPQLFDELWQEAMRKAEAEVNEGLDEKIASAINQEKEAMRAEAEDVVMEIAAQREAEFCGVLREVINALTSIPGVIPDENDEDEEEYEDDEDTESEEG